MIIANAMKLVMSVVGMLVIASLFVMNRLPIVSMLLHSAPNLMLMSATQ